MILSKIVIERESSNDETYTLVEKYVQDNVKVFDGTRICSIEGSKSLIDSL